LISFFKTLNYYMKIPIQQFKNSRLNLCTSKRKIAFAVLLSFTLGGMNGVAENVILSKDFRLSERVMSANILNAPFALPITGRVTDAEGEPLPGATIVIKGTTTGTTTDLDGNFS